MNVLFLVKGKDPYVTQQAQIELAAGLQKKCNLCLMGNITEELKVHLKKLNVRYIHAFPTKSIDKEYIAKFKNILEEYKIDIVHFVDGKSSRNGLIALKKFPKTKAITYFGSVSLHWYDPSSYLTYLNPRIDAIIGNSNFVYNHVKKQLFGKNKQKAVRIFKGYNPDWFTDAKPFDYTTLGIPEDSIVVCSVGNHRKIKGTKYFLESSNYLKTDKGVHYILIGHNTDTPSFQKIVANSKISKNIHILGSRTDVISLLKGADMFVQTSLSEGFGRAISEAMSVGKPVIMTNAGGCTELIDENSGIVVPLRDVKAIGGAISKLTNNDELRVQMGNNAKERISNVYHINRTIDETFALYKKLLNE